METAALSASLRSLSGVVPACASTPLTSTPNQWMPWMPVTAPMVRPSFSSRGALLKIMRLHVGREGMAEGALRQPRRGRQSLGERVFQRHSRAVHEAELVLQPLHAGEHRRPHGAGLETPALLIGPGDEVDGALGLHVGAGDGLQRLEAADDAVGAVEFAAARLAVEVAPCHHRRRIRLPAGAADVEVRDAVGRDLEAEIARPLHHQPAGAPILVRERGAVDPALLGRPDFRHRHLARPEPRLVHRRRSRQRFGLRIHAPTSRRAT